MSAILGYSFYAKEIFSDDSTSLQSVTYASFSDSIIDEIDINQDTSIGMTNTKDTWSKTSVLIAAFKNSLEAGNISDSGVKISKFKVLRRLVSQTEVDDIFLGEFDYNGADQDFEFIDVTQPNQSLIYSIVPVGENGLDGAVREITVDSTNGFTGWWVVDKDTAEVLPFDKAIGNVGTVEGTLNQDRTIIDTFSQYAQVYYGQKEYHTFTLSTVLVPDDGQNSSQLYLDVLNNFIRKHKSFIVKAANGMVYVANVGNIRFSTPLNTWNGYDPLTITIDCVETADYEDFMKGV